MYHCIQTFLVHKDPADSFLPSHCYSSPTVARFFLMTLLMTSSKMMRTLLVSVAVVKWTKSCVGIGVQQV